MTKNLKIILNMGIIAFVIYCTYMQHYRIIHAFFFIFVFSVVYVKQLFYYYTSVTNCEDSSCWVQWGDKLTYGLPWKEKKNTKNILLELIPSVLTSWLLSSHFTLQKSFIYSLVCGIFCVWHCLGCSTCMSKSNSEDLVIENNPTQYNDASLNPHVWKTLA